VLSVGILVELMIKKMVLPFSGVVAKATGVIFQMRVTGVAVVFHTGLG
jgi:hypothetical protein